MRISCESDIEYLKLAEIQSEGLGQNTEPIKTTHTLTSLVKTAHKNKFNCDRPHKNKTILILPLTPVQTKSIHVDPHTKE